ncbi:metallophosphoesterase [Polaromonas hydrogenivorans]|uniref:Metallophosphoesterase n=1 Tax=Polaromonas hydrogenivorans TaxID=335476 RepID=A0AAU7LZE4_9BURK
MASIFFCGDMHGSFAHIIQAVHDHQPDAIVLLGDLQAPRPLEVELAEILGRTEVWLIHGNHDTDSEADHDHLFGSSLAGRNLHGRVETVAGVRIAGLGGVFRGNVWSPPGPAHFTSREDFVARGGKGNRWRGGLALKHRSTIFPADVERLAKERAEVLVTHEAPSSHPHGFAAIDALARSLGVDKSFHGHHHDSLDYSGTWHALGVQARGVGFRGITDLDGRVIRAGDYDDKARR